MMLRGIAASMVVQVPRSLGSVGLHGRMTGYLGRACVGLHGGMTIYLCRAWCCGGSYLDDAAWVHV